MLSVLPGTTPSWMVWPLLAMVSTRSCQAILIAGSCALIECSMSMGDCCVPTAQTLLAASISPQWAGPSPPS